MSGISGFSGMSGLSGFSGMSGQLLPQGGYLLPQGSVLGFEAGNNLALRLALPKDVAALIEPELAIDHRPSHHARRAVPVVPYAGLFLFGHHSDFFLFATANLRKHYNITNITAVF